jgi:uncharacterized membrane protein
MFDRFINGFIALVFSGAFTGAILAYALRQAEYFSVPLLLIMIAGGAILLPAVWIISSRNISRITTWTIGTSLGKTVLPFASICTLPILYLPFLWNQGHVSNENLPGGPPLSPFWQALIIFVCASSMVFGLLALQIPELRRGPIKSVTQHPVEALIAMMVLFVVITSTMDILRSYFMNGASAPAVISEALNNIISDRGPLYTSHAQANGSSILGIHAWFIWFLVYPFYRIWPSWEMLLILAKVALGLAAIPIYYLSRRFFSNGWCLLIAGIYLLNRTIMAQAGTSHVSEQDFLPVLFISALYFWQAKRFRPFILFAFLALLIREDVGVILALLGFISLLKKYSAKWWVILVSVGIVWFMFMTFWLVPHMNPTGSVRMQVVYSDLDSSNGSAATGSLHNPFVAVKNLFSTPQHVAVLYNLMLSFGFVAPLFSVMVFLPIPFVLETLLLSHPTLNHYNAVAISAALMPAMIFGFVGLNRFTRRRWRLEVSPFLIILTLFATAGLSFTWLTPSRFEPRYNYDVAVSILESIPDGSSAILPDYMVPRAYKNLDIRSFNQEVYESQEPDGLKLDQEYIVLDNSKFPEAWTDVSYYKGLALVKQALKESPDYRLIRDEDDLQLYYRTY